MKALHAVLLLSAINNFSLYSMSIIPRKTNNLPFHRTIKNSVVKEDLISTKKAQPFLKKAQQFFNMSDINNIASAGNIVAAGVTGNPLYLLLIIPQILQRTSTYLHMQKSAELKTFEEDVDFLLNKPIIQHSLYKITVKDYEIKSFATSSDLQQLERLNLLDEHNNKISKLEKEKSQAEHTLIKETEYFFDTNNTPELLNQAKKHLDAAKFVDYSCVGVNMTSALAVPWMLLTWNEASCLHVLCTTLNGMIFLKNVNSAASRANLNNSLQDAIKISNIKNLNNNQSVNE